MARRDNSVACIFNVEINHQTGTINAPTYKAMNSSDEGASISSRVEQACVGTDDDHAI